jgi:chlorobactene glucosyltransferase
MRPPGAAFFVDGPAVDRATAAVNFAEHMSLPVGSLGRSISFRPERGVGEAVELLVSAAWLAIMVLLIVRAIRQRGLLPRLAAASPPDRAPLIAVIVPARDEEENIGRCLESLVAQDYPAGRLRVLVVDDHSQDRTAAVVGGMAARHGQVELLRSPPLPVGWVGKSHACWNGARAALGETQWLCFVDADVTLKPAALSSAVNAASLRNLDLLSLAPHQELRSFAERLILPCGLILLSFLQNLRRLQARTGRDVTATGQFMMVRRDAYHAAGGHAAVCGAICEDLELARRLKQAGYSVLLMGGETLVAARMYTGWETLWPGLAKNLIDTLGGPVATVAIALAAFVLAWAAIVIPLTDLASWLIGVPDAGIALCLALAASGAAFGLHIAATSYFRIPFWYGLIFPIGYSVGAVMAVDSVRLRLSGKVSWKGRIYS